MPSEELGEEVRRCLEGAINDIVEGAGEGFKGVFNSKEEGSSEGGGVARVPERSGEVGGKVRDNHSFTIHHLIPIIDLSSVIISCCYSP